MTLGRYSSRKNSGSSTSATFNAVQTALTAQAIEAIYSDGSAQSLEALVNRNLSRNNSDRKDGEFQLYLLPKLMSPRFLSLSMKARRCSIHWRNRAACFEKGCWA